MDSIDPQSEPAKLRELTYYRPRVEIGGADLAFAIGPYRLLYCSKQLKSFGAIHYRHLLVALDEDDNDVIYVTAESNAMDGESAVYLGSFQPRRHATLTNSAALAEGAFFLPVACMVARQELQLPYEEFPLTNAECGALGEIPSVLQALFPERADGCTARLVADLRSAVARSR